MPSDVMEIDLGLSGLPSRGIMGVTEGCRPLPAGPGPAYICQQPSPTLMVRNPAVRLIDMYKASARKRLASTAAAAGGAAGTKRPAGPSQQEQQAGKRHQPEAAADAAVTQLGSKQTQQQTQPQRQQPRSTPLAAGTQQQRGTALPLATLPNGSTAATPAATAAPAAAASGACSTGKELLQYSAEQMMLFSNKKLTELLKGCGLKQAGKKEEMVRRLLEYQRRLRKAAQSSNTAAAGHRAVHRS